MGTFMEDMTFGLDLKTWGRFQLAVLVRIASQAESMSAKLENEQAQRVFEERRDSLNLNGRIMLEGIV